MSRKKLALQFARIFKLASENGTQGSETSTLRSEN